MTTHYRESTQHQVRIALYPNVQRADVARLAEEEGAALVDELFEVESWELWQNRSLCIDNLSHLEASTEKIISRDE